MWKWIKTAIYQIENRLNWKLIKDELRRLGVNLITTGVAGIFITHVLELNTYVIISAIIVSFVGLFLLVFGALD